MSDLSTANILNLVIILIFVYSLLLGTSRSRNMIIGFFSMGFLAIVFNFKLGELSNSFLGKTNPLTVPMLVTVWGILNASLISPKHPSLKKISLINIISSIFVSLSLAVTISLSTIVTQGNASGKYWQMINNNLWNVSLACFIWLSLTLILFKGHDKK